MQRRPVPGSNALLRYLLVVEDQRGGEIVTDVVQAEVGSVPGQVGAFCCIMTDHNIQAKEIGTSASSTVKENERKVNARIQLRLCIVNTLPDTPLAST